MNLLEKIKDLFVIEYRLTVLYRGEGTPEHIRHRSRRILKAIAKNLHGYQYWSLYKRGAMGLPERLIDCSDWHKKGGVR